MVLLKYTNLHQFSFIILINLLIKYCLFETSEEFCKKYDKDSQSSCLMIQNWVQERDGVSAIEKILNFIKIQFSLYFKKIRTMQMNYFCIYLLLIPCPLI